jgi:hypothetical protein
VVTPQAIENRLAMLSKEVDEAHRFLEEAEYKYHKAKTAYEIEIAHSYEVSARENTCIKIYQDTALIFDREQYEALIWQKQQ